jgi:hypothetical protein
MRGVTRRRAQKATRHDLSRPWTRRRVVSTSLLTLALVIAIQHLVAHFGFRPMPISMDWQDILIGYPMAAVLALVGAMALEPHPRG